MNVIAVFDDMLSSTDSDSDEQSDLDEMFDDIFDDYEVNVHRIPPVENFIVNVVHNFNDEEFRENFRLRRDTFNYLLFILRDQLEGNANGFGNVRISAERQLLIALWVLGTPDSYRSITSKFGVAKSTAWCATYRVVRALCNYRNYFIRWPSPAEAQETAARIEQRFGFPGVIGALDGTHIYIAAPTRNANDYINRKGRHSIQLQVICNDKLEFIHCYAGMSGSVHDMRVYRYSGVQNQCNDQFFPNNTHLLADAAYTLQRHIMVPYRDDGHLTLEEIRFNTMLSRSRMMVERAIGLLKMRWRYFLDKIPMRRTDLIPYYILAICILHNIFLKRNDDFQYPVIIPDTINGFPEPEEVDIQSREYGVIKRENIRHILNRDIVNN